MLIRLNRWAKRLLIPLAAVPLFQAAGTCDATSLANLAASSALDLGAQFNVAVFQLFVSGVQQTLLNNFPSANLLQILLGVNRQPFFP